MQVEKTKGREKVALESGAGDVGEERAFGLAFLEKGACGVVIDVVGEGGEGDLIVHTGGAVMA